MEVATKHPIILVHGVALKDFKTFKAFGKIESVLKEAGYDAYTARTDGFGKIETNAVQLKTYIEEILKESNAEKVNIVAHSKGGLDTRYMIDTLGLREKVASVTFLCTPHKGSQIATKLYALPSPIKHGIALPLNFWYKIFGDEKPDVLEVCRHLTHSPDGVLNDFGDHDGIFMQSYSTTLKRSRDDFIMGIPLIFSRKFEADSSDGMVSVESSKFREYRGDCTDESVSHSEIVDFMANKKKKEKIYAFYLSLAEELEARGY